MRSSRPSGVLAMALLALASTVAVVCALVANADEPGRFRTLDVIAAGLALAVAAALVRGAADTEEVLRGGGSGALLIALPVAVVAIVGIVAARVLPRLVLLVARALPDRRLTARLALLSIARRPGAGATAVAFLVVSIGLAVFAGTYRATLEQGRRDQAAFALGADLVLREDLSRLVPVREVATPERLQRLGPRVAAAPVLRATGNVAGLSDVTGVAVLGVEPALLRTLRGSDLELPSLAVAADLDGPRLGDTLPSRARSSIPGVSVEAALRLRDGSFERVLLGTPLPARARGSTLLGLRIVPPPRLQERGADAGVPTVGTIELPDTPRRRLQHAGSESAARRSATVVSTSRCRARSTRGSVRVRRSTAGLYRPSFRARWPSSPTRTDGSCCRSAVDRSRCASCAPPSGSPRREETSRLPIGPGSRRR